LSDQNAPTISFILHSICNRNRKSSHAIPALYSWNRKTPVHRYSRGGARYFRGDSSYGGGLATPARYSRGSHGEGGTRQPSAMVPTMESLATFLTMEDPVVVQEPAAPPHLQTYGMEARRLVHSEPSWPPRQELPAGGRGRGGDVSDTPGATAISFNAASPTAYNGAAATAPMAYHGAAPMVLPAFIPTASPSFAPIASPDAAPTRSNDVAPTAAGWLEWGTGPTVAALGPDWLRTDLKVPAASLELRHRHRPLKEPMNGHRRGPPLPEVGALLFPNEVATHLGCHKSRMFVSLWWTLTSLIQGKELWSCGISFLNLLVLQSLIWTAISYME
jgi:hypothetical protein